MKQFAVLILLGLLTGQESPLVTGIEIAGNDVTAEDIIRREIYHELNVPLDSAIVQEDVNRLLNLGIFNDVMYRIYLQPDSTVRLTYIMVEAWRILPMISPLYSDDTGWSLLTGLGIKNFRGRNQFLNASIAWGGLDAYGFAFYDPWITGDHLSLQIEIRSNDYQHLYLPARIREKYTSLILGHYFGATKKMNVGLKLVNKTFYDGGRRGYEYWSPVFQYQWDTRDLYSNPQKGHLVIFLFEGTYGLQAESVQFSRFYPSFSVYHRLTSSRKPLILTGNVTMDVITGDVPEYFQTYFGGSYTVRGWSRPHEAMYRNPQKAFRFGTQSWMSTLELRKNILPKYTPAPGLEFSLDLGVFVDIGAIGPTLDLLAQQSPMMGVGVGLRIPFTAYECLRFDYALGFYQGRYTDRTFHLAYGFKF
ncbi:MAG: BamA/TamA family outer membrane protein [Fidelibacterota bacterium]